MRPVVGWKVLLAIMVLLVGILLIPRRQKSTMTSPLSCESPLDTYLTFIHQARRQKDSVFKVDPFSPIPEEKRAGFSGLKYFPVNRKWCLQGKYEPLPNALPPVGGAIWLDLPTLDSCREASRLLLYKGRQGEVYMAFWDSTAALGMTYEGGRYVPVQIKEGIGFVDFNQAYFPYCAYDSRYICLPYPPENRLCISVLAGERW
ncbi:MAG: DUF1684 domain-containing protein [Bacteroidia bacterium]|nr:DUF1684 domain-containing protein [Bacteroidia bacterium]MDW8134092.1 DUF1684 domain-containing protein [Bacteroidia bacterium]